MLSIICFALTLAGLCFAAAAIIPLSEVAELARTQSTRRAWQALVLIIAACISLQFVAALFKAHKNVDAGDVLAAAVHLLGPGFVFCIAWLSRRTARDLVHLADLERAARLDWLTGLPNKRLFDIRLAEAIETAQRSKRALTLVLVDVDHFKRVNDTFGHRAGDRVLKQVADHIARAVPMPGIACRIGGEEFALVLPDLSAARSRALIERLRVAIEGTDFGLSEYETAAPRPTRVTASFGVAALMATDDAGPLIERADAALYAAKRAGRNRISLAA